MEQNILHIKEVDSSNEFLKSLYKSSDFKQPFCVYTDYQSSGKGQRGNKWQSEAGANLLCSFLVEGIEHPSQLPILNLASVLAVVKTLDAFGISQTKIKWPNDVYVGDMKIAGTLVENVFEGNVVKFSVIGIGLNVNQQTFSDLQACSMKSLSSIEYDIPSVLAILYHHIYNQFQFKAVKLLEEVNSRLYKKSKSVTFMHKTEYKDYTVLGIQLNGSLLVENDTEKLELEHHNHKWIK